MKKLLYLLLSIAAFSPISHAVANDLAYIYEQAQTSDPRIVIDTHGLEVGKARERQRLGALLPQVGLSSNLNRSGREIDGLPGTDYYPGERYALTVQQALYDPEKYRGWLSAKETTQQFSHQLEDTKAMVRLDTVERYFALLQAQDELSLVQDEIAALRKQQKQTQELYHRQLIQITEVLDIDSRIVTLLADEIEAMQMVDMAKASLRELTDAPINDVSKLKDSAVFKSETEELSSLLSTANRRNPALQALTFEIDAAQMNVSSQRAAHLPKVTLQLSRQKSDIGFENAQTPKTETDTASLNFNLPLYSGGGTSARVDEAAAQLSISEATREQKLREIHKQIEEAYLGINTQIERIRASEKVIESAVKAEKARSRSFELGVGTIADVIEARREVSAAKRKYQQARYDFVLNRARLLYLVGNLDDKAVYDINGWLESRAD